MSDVDDAIRGELARLVRPADTDAVMEAVAARRAVTEPKHKRSWLVAAAVIAVLGMVGLGVVSSQSGEPGITASAGGLDVPGFLPAVVPEGADLVSFHKFDLDDWTTPTEPWVTPGRYTLSYRDLTDPFGEPSFDLEVFPGVELDVDAALTGFGGDSEIVRVGEATGVRVSSPDSNFGSGVSDRIIWQVTSGTVIRIDASGIASEEVAAIAASVRSVDEAAWSEALAGADIAPPYGFRGETTMVSGNGWSITAGMYRQAFGLPSGCAVLELDEPNGRDRETPACVSALPVPEELRSALSVDAHHVWVDDRLLVWGVPPEGARSVRLVYDEGTFEASPDETGSLIRAEPIPGVDTFFFVAELEVAREPSRVEVLDGDGKIISSYEDRTARELPPKPDRKSEPPVDITSAETAFDPVGGRAVVTQFLDLLREGDLEGAAAKWTGYPELAPDTSAADRLPYLENLMADPTFTRILGSNARTTFVTPSTAASGQVVTVLDARDGQTPPTAIAFLTGLSDEQGRPGEVWIHRLPLDSLASVDLHQGSYVEPGEDIVVPGTPVEGGARAFVNDQEVAVDVDHVNLTMTLTIPKDVEGDVAVTIVTSSPELPGVRAFAVTVRG